MPPFGGPWAKPQAHVRGKARRLPATAAPTTITTTSGWAAPPPLDLDTRRQNRPRPDPVRLDRRHDRMERSASESIEADGGQAFALAIGLDATTCGGTLCGACPPGAPSWLGGHRIRILRRVEADLARQLERRCGFKVERKMGCCSPWTLLPAWPNTTGPAAQSTSAAPTIAGGVRLRPGR